MPQIAIAAASAISITSTGALAFSVSTFALNAALGFALTALTPKPTNDAGNAYSGEAVDSTAAHQIIYGRTRVGGVRVYSEETDNAKYLHKIIAIAGHEVQSFDEVYLNDELVALDGSGMVTSPGHYAGLVRIKLYLGEATQVADADLVAESAGLWTTAHRLQGIAYIYARFEFDADAYPNGEPVITAVIKGRKVYDPRSGMTAWTDNTALCLRDYITSKYGLQEVTQNIDDDLVGAAANICEEVVTITDGTEARYTCNGAILANVAPVDGINAILITMGGTLWYSQGKWRMKAGAWTTPVQTFDENDLRSGLSITTRNSRRDNFNIVGGTFRGEETLWVEDEYPEYRSDTFIQVDGGLESRAEINLAMVASSATAQRLAKLALYRSRDQITFTATFSLSALQVQVGDVVYINNSRAGWTAKAFEVQEWNFIVAEDMALLVKMNLREISQSAFDWALADESIFETNNSVLTDPFYVEPIGLSVSSTTDVTYEKLTNVLYANVTSANSSNIRLVEVQFKKSADADWRVMGSGPVGQYSFVDVEDAAYDVRARAANYLDVRSDWVVVTSFQVSGLDEPPTDVSTFTANLSGSNITLTWAASPDPDLSHYVIRHSVEESGATFANATTAAEKVSRPATSITLPARPGTFHVKAYDKTGHASVNYASAIIPTAAMPTFTTNSTIVRSTATNYNGTKSNTTAAAGDLRLSNFTTAPATGTYDPDAYIDTGASRRITSRVDVATTRYATASALWDDMSGNWDDWPGNWDDWTGAVQLPDTDVVCYISTTNDDPAGSPTWSAYAPFTAGEFYARAFRFRVELKTETANVTPSISSITARVSY